MLIINKRNELQNPLLASIIGIGLIIIFATFISKEATKTVTDILYVTITGISLALTSILASRFGNKGNHGKAWLFFLGAASSWFIAETTWTVYELAYNVNPFPSIADIFYIIGYPFLFGFLIHYLKPVRKMITKKMLVTAICISATISISSVYMTYSFDPSIKFAEYVLSTIYPIFDAILIVPALIGVFLFFRGEVNFTWSLICMGILCFTIGDIGFKITTFTNTYYTGHPVDIILIWAYVLFSFGVYDHIKIFKKDKSQEFRT